MLAGGPRPDARLLLYNSTTRRQQLAFMMRVGVRVDCRTSRGGGAFFLISKNSHVYHHSYQDVCVYWYHMESHNTLDVASFSSITWQVWAIPNGIEITCGWLPPTTSGDCTPGDRQMPDHDCQCHHYHWLWSLNGQPTPSQTLNHFGSILNRRRCSSLLWLQIWWHDMLGGTKQADVWFCTPIQFCCCVSSKIIMFFI